MIKASRFAIAIAAVASLAIATMEESLAAPVTVGANAAWRPRQPRCSIGPISTMTMVHTLTARPTDTEATRTGIPATGIGRTPATITTTTGGKRPPALKALGFSVCSTTSVPAGDARRDWAPSRVVRLPFNAVG
jgi:hypothetical protein